MKNIQELIKLLRIEKEKAHSQYKVEEIGSLEERYLLGKFAAFSLAVDKAESLSAPQPHSKPSPKLQQCNVRGALPLSEIIDMLNKAHEALAKSEISQDEYSHISWALLDAKKRIWVLLSGNDS